MTPAKKAITILALFCTTSPLLAQSVVGQWKTIDDNTSKPRSIVELYKKNGKLYGKITKLFTEPGEEANPNCEECPGNLKGTKIIGLEILDGLTLKDKIWSGGKILDPESGKWYDCKIWLNDENQLSVRGYVMLFYRTQTWVKIK